MLAMDLPEFLLEEVFTYLSWSDRARAARVCHKWLSVFQTPSLWRRMVFRPPTRALTRLQYDMKGYYMSCCLRKIGWYVREYRFIETEDIFLLNRTLSLVAKFLEANPPTKPTADSPPQRQRHHSTALGGSLEEPEDSQTSSDSSDFDNKPPLNEEAMNSMEDDDGDVQDAPDAEEQRMSSYLGLITGDPDAEATLKLILKLQERDMYGGSSNSSSSETDEEFISSMHTRSAAMSVSIPRSAWPTPPSRATQPKTTRFQRSNSCRYPRYSHVIRQPPMVRTFVLDFHCEVDETRGFIYGTGGALLTTIRRVLRQLVHLQRLRLTDLFLTATDARNLLLDLTKACSSSLLNLNLVHLYKPWAEFNDFAPVRSGLTHNEAPGRTGAPPCGLDDDWFLLDSRWLGARPRRLHNPMSDLASLFPSLMQLSLGITQLTGPMLLRLLYQTNLMELRIVQTDFTPLTLAPVSRPGDFQMPFQARPSASQGDRRDEEPDSFNSLGLHPQDEQDDDLIDWGEDVPRYRDHISLAGQAPSFTPSWEPIREAMWNAALILRPRLNVQLHFLFTRARFDYLSHIDQLLTLWPAAPAPIGAVVFRTSHGIRFSATCLSLKNPVNLTSYSATLTTLILWIDAISDVQNAENKAEEAMTEWDALNECLQDVLPLCPHLSFVAFGGYCSYLSLLTVLTMCHQRTRRRSIENNYAGPADFTFLIQLDCCQINDSRPVQAPATVQAWYSTVVENGKDPQRRALAAERCISAALNQPCWHFLSAGEFESHVSDYFD